MPRRVRPRFKRFLTEAQSIAALNHFNIVQIHDYGRDKDGPFLIMEYVGGGSLLDKCREGALPLEEAVELTCQLCDGLEMAHDAGIIHRDIKPANVLLTSRGEPKLTDFGLARQRAGDTGQTAAGVVLGTLDFMPPEQRRDATQTDNRSDLWSLAATLYQMVSGEPPRVIDLDEVPQQLRTTLSKALKTKPDARYQTAGEFRDALRASQQDTGTETLEEGSCPGCGTKNPTNRKFCRNEDCGIDLQVACLSCSEKMPMWEGVCDSCGTKQSALLDERRSRMASDQSEAESLLKSFDFDRAIELTTALRDEPDLRLQHLNGWAEKFLPQIDQGRQQQLDDAKRQREEACAEAKRLLDTGDAKGALAMIQSVSSEDLRSSDEPLRRELEEIVAAEDKLTALVKESKAEGVLDPDEVVSMWQATVSYLKLNPRHEKIAELQQQLEARIQKAPDKYAEFAELAGFWPTLPSSVLSQLPASVLSPVIVKMPVKSNSIGMSFKSFPGGTFTMGDGNTPHHVTLTQPFELGVYEVTQEQYEAVMGTNPSRFKGSQNPVEQVSWDDAVEFCRKLSELPAEKKAGYVYRLPTEAEWEYACRAGTTTEYSYGDSDSKLGAYGWYEGNSGRTTHPVGKKKPNAWGLYDMHGNVWEWCQDWYGNYPSGSVTDPTGPASGDDRVLRGGSFLYRSSLARSALRNSARPDSRSYSFGFRPARTHRSSP